MQYNNCLSAWLLICINVLNKLNNIKMRIRISRFMSVKNLSFIVFFSTVLIISCQKDMSIEESGKTTFNRSQSSLLDIFALTNDTDLFNLNSAMSDLNREELRDIYENAGYIRERGYVLSDSLGVKVCAFPFLKNEAVNGVILSFQDDNNNYYKWANSVVLNASPQQLVSELGKGESYLFMQSMFLFEEETNGSMSQHYADAMTLVNDIDDDIQAFDGDCFEMNVVMEITAVTWISSHNAEYVQTIGFANNPIVFCHDSGSGGTGGGSGGYSGGGGGNNTNNESTDREDCMDNIPANLILEAEEYLEQFDFPCNDSDIINDAIDAHCDGTNRGSDFKVNFVKNIVDGISKIKFPPGFNSKCPCFRKVFSALMESGETKGDNWLCRMLTQVNDSENFSLGFNIKDTINGLYFSPTLFSGSGVHGNININTSICNGQNLNRESSLVFVHEMMHAFFFTELADKFEDVTFNFMDRDSWGDDWDALVRYWLNIPDDQPVIGNHHYLFATQMADVVAEALWVLDGSDPNKSFSDFLYEAHVILNTKQLVAALNGEVLDDNGNVKYPDFMDLLSPTELNFLQSFDVEGLNTGSSYVINCNM